MATGKKPSEWSAATITAILNRLTAQSCVIVETTDDATTNGTNLLAAYTEATALTPNGSALAADNRATVILPPAVYDLAEQLEFDTEYVDVVTLTGAKDALFTSNTVRLSVGNVTLRGLNVGTQNFKIKGGISGYTLENCEGGQYSYNSDDDDATNENSTVCSGTFINCIGGADSFGDTTADGTFIDCVAGATSFAAYGTASGTFTRCKGGNACFGTGTEASGTFVDCEAEGDSFGSYGAISGTFIRCKDTTRGFGSVNGGTITGTLYFCINEATAFPTPGTGGAIYASIDSNGFNAEILPV